MSKALLVRRTLEIEIVSDLRRPVARFHLLYGMVCLGNSIYLRKDTKLDNLSGIDVPFRLQQFCLDIVTRI